MIVSTKFSTSDVIQMLFAVITFRGINAITGSEGDGIVGLCIQFVTSTSAVPIQFTLTFNFTTQDSKYEYNISANIMMSCIINHT